MARLTKEAKKFILGLVSGNKVSKKELEVFSKEQLINIIHSTQPVFIKRTIELAGLQEDNKALREVSDHLKKENGCMNIDIQQLQLKIKNQQKSLSHEAMKRDKAEDLAVAHKPKLVEVEAVLTTIKESLVFHHNENF